MNKQRKSSNLINILSYDDAGNIVLRDYSQTIRYNWNGTIHAFTGPLSISSIAAAVTDTDRFLVSDGGTLKYRTGTEVLSDIGGVPSTRTLTINGVTQDLSANRTFTIAAGITGTGVAGQVAYWNGTGSVTGSANLVWDNTNSRLGIGTSSPRTYLNIAGVGNVSDTTASLTIDAYSNTYGDYRGAGTLVLSKSASNTLGTLTTTRNADSLANIVIQGVDTANNRQSTFVITASQNGASGSGFGSVKSDLNFFSFSKSTSTPILYLKNNGDIGIGTNNLTTYTNYVHVALDGVLGSFTQYRTNASNLFAVGSESTYGYLATGTAGMSINFFTSGSERMRLTSAGRLLLGTTTESTFLLDVNGTARVGSIRTGNFGSGDSIVFNTQDYSFSTVSNVLRINMGSGVNNKFDITNQGGNTAFRYFTGGLYSNFGMYQTDLFSNNQVASAILELRSNAMGFLPPRMTNAQRTAISSPAVGLIVYQTDGTEGTYEYASTGWRIINSAAAGGAGTVTSVGLSLPSIFTVSNSPVTSTGTLTATLATQTANTIFAGPTTGVAAAPTFRAIVAADIPTLNQNTTGSAATLTTARTITIGSTGKTFNGSADVSWTLAEIGAYSSANPSGYTNNTGTVTTVSVVTANGISATYTNQTTTPAITLSLGAITPTSVNSVVISGSTTPTLAVTGTSSISGSNTGDNAVNSLYSGLVSNATHTGDATGATSLTVVGLRGVALPALGATAGFLRYTGTGANTWVFDSSTYLTAAITSLGGLTAASQTFANDTNVTITSATSTHTLGWTGQLSVARGGTGASTLTGVLIGNGTGAVTAVAGTASQLLRRNAGNTAYEFFTHDFVSTAGATFTGQIISTLANSTTTGGAQVYLNGTTGNRIDFNTNGSADPAFTTRSVGTKIVLRPLLTGTTLDYAIGIGNLGQSMWVSLPTATSTHSFRVIAGAISSSVFRITGDGNTYALTFNAEAINATIGIKAQLSATIDSYNEDDTAFVSANVTGSAGVADYKWYHSPSARFATWSWSANTFDRTYTLPNASGTIPISVNGQTADADGNITISTGGGSAYSVTSVSTTYSETATSGTKIIKATTAGGTFVITLPTAVGNTATIIIKKTAGTAALTVDGFNTETIDGGLNATINKVDESITLVSDNSNWLII